MEDNKINNGDNMAEDVDKLSETVVEEDNVNSKHHHSSSHHHDSSHHHHHHSHGHSSSNRHHKKNKGQKEINPQSFVSRLTSTDDTKIEKKFKKTKFYRKFKQLKKNKTFVVLASISLVLIIAVVVFGIVKCNDTSVVRSELLFNHNVVQNGQYQCPVDFKKLQSINPDIYAWLDIPGSNISYPVVNKQGNNEFYLVHNSDGNWDGKGAIFSEDYNTRDFTDPVVELFGHHMRNHTMFADLQQTYSDKVFFETHKDVNIYMPEKMITYKVFAAIPFSSVHILHNYNFKSVLSFNKFFDAVYNSRSIDGLIDSTVKVEFNKDRVLILSTCLSGNNTNRFLVFAVDKT